MGSPATEKGTRGGKRPGAGRPNATVAKRREPHQLELLEHKARRERIRADREEMDLRRDAGQLVELSEVVRIYGQAVATFTEQMRALADRLERRCGLTPEQAELAEEMINEELARLGKKLTANLSE